MITVQMSDVLGARSLFTKINSQNLPIKTAYKLTKIFDAIEKELNFYSSSLTKITDKFAMKDENGDFVIEGDGIRINPEYMTECQEKINELNNLSLTLETPFLTLDELEHLEISLTEMKLLSKFICE